MICIFKFTPRTNTFHDLRMFWSRFFRSIFFYSFFCYFMQIEYEICKRKTRHQANHFKLFREKKYITEYNFWLCANCIISTRISQQVTFFWFDTKGNFLFHMWIIAISTLHILQCYICILPKFNTMLIKCIMTTLKCILLNTYGSVWVCYDVGQRNQLWFCVVCAAELISIIQIQSEKKIIGNCQIASTAYSLFSNIEIVHLEPTNVHGNIESIVRFVVASAHVAFVRRCWSRAWKGVRNREIDRWVESYLIHSQIIQTILAIHFRNFFYSSSS